MIDFYYLLFDQFIIIKFYQIQFISSELPHPQNYIPIMSHLKEDFQTHLLSNLNAIVQQQESLELQNHNLNNQLSQLGNSFISEKHEFQTNNQNLNIYDQTLTETQIHSHPHDLQTHTENQKLSKLHNNQPSLHSPQTLETQEFKNSSKLQEQLSQEKSFFPGSQNYSFTDQFSSFNDQEMGGGMIRGGSRKKILPQNLNLNHKDHMMLGGKVISGLEKNIVSLPFREPVDVQRFNIPDYMQIVKQPMDLKTIKRKIFNEEYLGVDQIYADIELIISNSMKYNEYNPDFIRLTKNFQKSYFKIRRDCQRNMRKFKLQEEKKNESFSNNKTIRKHIKTVQTHFPSNQVQVMSNFEFKQLAKLAKKIRKLQAYQQIELFKKIDINHTMVIDIKTLNTKQVRSLMREVEKIQKSKQEHIRNEQKKENSHLTRCDAEYKCQI